MALVGFWMQKTIVKIDAYQGDTSIGTATGFIVDLDDEFYLVSAWHVFSGRNIWDGQPISSNGATPNIFQLTFTDWSHTPSGGIGELRQLSIHLHDEQNDFRWFQHPSLGQEIDIGVLKITKEISCWYNRKWYENHKKSMVADVGCELFLPSFPLGFTSHGVWPIVKRASLASVIDQYGGPPTFYIDTASRRGMSGAPVFLWTNGPHWVQPDMNSAPFYVSEPGISLRLLGVYSGRENSSDNGEAQIGRVFHEYLIPQIIAGGVKGAPEIR